MTTLQMATPVAAQVTDAREAQEAALERLEVRGRGEPIGSHSAACELPLRHY